MALLVYNFDVTPLSVEPLMELLKGLSPASIDSEFHNMAPDAGGSVDWMEYFMEFLLDQLKTNKNYELVQSYLGLFLKVRVKRILLNFALPPPPPPQIYLLSQITNAPPKYVTFGYSSQALSACRPCHSISGPP